MPKFKSTIYSLPAGKAGLQSTVKKVGSRSTSDRKGFTLIELMVAITILAIVSTIGLTTYFNAQRVGRDGRRKDDIRQLAVGLQVYHAANKAYPNKTVDSLSAASWQQLFLPGAITDYINIIPSDPTNSGPLNYRYSGTATTYTLCTNLENDLDKDRNTVCSGSYDFGVRNP